MTAELLLLTLAGLGWLVAAVLLGLLFGAVIRRADAETEVDQALDEWTRDVKIMSDLRRDLEAAKGGKS